MTDKMIAVSTAPVSNDQIIDYIVDIENMGADFIHCEARDGVVVDNATFDEKGLYVLLKNAHMPVDVHLMIYQPLKQLRRYLSLKPNTYILQYDHFSYEKHLRKALIKIKRARIHSGLALTPGIPVSYILPFVPYIDELLIMGENPDGTGLVKIEESINKIKNAVDLKQRFKKDLIISYKGGVNFDNAKKLFDAGVNKLIADYVVYNCFSRTYAVENLRNPSSKLLKEKNKLH